MDGLVKFLALVIASTLLPGCAPAGDDARNKGLDLPSRIDAVLAGASADGSGFAIIVELDGEVIVSNGYGHADRESRSPFTPETIAQIGSLTKQFTATAVLHLAEAGKVELMAPLRTYLPELESPAGDITLHQLLTHSAGLPEYCGDDFDPLSRDNFIDSCLGAPLVFEPGTDVAYSNVGYSVIAAVIDVVAEQGYETYLEDRVLRPNGLGATGHLFAESFDGVFARGYLDDQDMGNIAERIEALDGDWWNLKGNGGMQASTLDMYAWYRALNGHGVLSDAVRARLTVPHSPWSDGVAEGYGWFFRSDDGSRIRQMSHSGSDGVFFSYYWHRVDRQAFMYFVGNGGEEPTKVALREVLSILNEALDGPQ